MNHSGLLNFERQIPSQNQLIVDSIRHSCRYLLMQINRLYIQAIELLIGMISYCINNKEYHYSTQVIVLLNLDHPLINHDLPSFNWQQFMDINFLL